MMKELIDMNVELPSERDADLELWDYWCARSGNRNKHSRMMINRFMALVDKARIHQPWWTWDLFEREMLGLEMQLLNKKKFVKKVIVKAKDKEPAGEAGGPTTPSSGLVIEDKTLRSFADEAICLSIALLSDYNNKRLVEIFLSSTVHVLQWRSEMSRATKSTQDTLEFLTAQAAGGFMSSIRRGVLQLNSLQFLQRAHFEIPTATTKPAEINEADVQRDEEFADIAWSLEQALGAERLVRLLHLYGWPHRWVSARRGGHWESNCFRDFQDDWRIYENLCGIDDPFAQQKRLRERHLFNLTTNQQYKAACDELGYGSPAHPDFKRQMLDERFAALVTTTICEEQVGCAKNAFEVKTSNRFRKPEVSMHKCLRSQFCGRYGLDMVSPDVAAPNRTVRLDDAAFRPKADDWSLPFDTLQGHKSEAPYFSPAATNINVPVADLVMLRHADTMGDLGLVQNAGLGALFSFKHKFVFEYAEPCKWTDSGVVLKWLLPWKHLPNSAVLCIEYDMVTLPDTKPPVIMFNPRVGEVPCFASIFNFGQARRACKVVVHSWLYQRKYLAKAMGNATPAIRLFKNGPFESVPKLACRDGWWLLTKDTILEAASAEGVEVPPASTTMQAIATTGMSLLKCGAQEAMGCAQMRLANLKDSNRWCKELLQVDEAMELLDRDEYQMMTDRQKVAIEAAEEVNAYGKEFAAARKALGDIKIDKYPDNFPLEIPQATVKMYIPPTSSVWRGNVRSEWWGHMPPYRRVHKACKDFDSERDTIKELLKVLWVQFNEKYGRDKFTCPVKGIFADG